MKRVCVLFAIVFFLMVSVQAQGISISGTITGSGVVISDARVSIKNYPHLVAYTDATGAFSIDGSLPIVNQLNSSVMMSPALIKNNILQFTTIEQVSSVTVELFNMRGSRLYTKKLTNVTPGSHNIPLMKTAQGTYVVRLQVGVHAYLMKMTAGNVGMVSMRTNAPERRAASAGVVDTLIVVAQNWKNALVDLPDYDEQLAVTLTPSNPWKPSGALVYDKGMVKVVAKGHDFEMGQPDPDIGGEGLTISEQPVHTVQFTYDFWMDTVEVTQKEFDTIMKQGYAEYVTPFNWDDRYSVGDSIPAYYLFWGNAVLYCNARSKIEGLDTVYTYSSISAPPGEVLELTNVAFDLSKNGYRLPTEAEWEYACKGGSGTDYYWGKNVGDYPATTADSAEIGENCIWYANAEVFGLDVPGYGNQAVGSKKPNAYGLYDMAGNASEFCHDYYVEKYEYGIVVDPAGPATSDEIHCIRGGNWGFGAEGLRSANRNPTFDPPNYPFFYIGFRVVKPIP